MNLVEKHVKHGNSNMKVSGENKLVCSGIIKSRRKDGKSARGGDCRGSCRPDTRLMGHGKALDFCRNRKLL